MAADLIPIIPGRPPILRLNGQIVYLSVRDAEYLRVKASFKRRLREANLLLHSPIMDNGTPSARKRSPAAMYRLLDIYRGWKERQRRQYWIDYRMTPPDWTGQPEKPPDWLDYTTPGRTVVHQSTCARYGRLNGGPACTCGASRQSYRSILRAQQSRA